MKGKLRKGKHSLNRTKSPVEPALHEQPSAATDWMETKTRAKPGNFMHLIYPVVHTAHKQQ